MCWIISGGRRSKDREHSISDPEDFRGCSKRQNASAPTLMKYLAMTITFGCITTVVPKWGTQDYFFRPASSCASLVQLRGCNLCWILYREHADEYLELQICRGCRNKVAEMVDKVLGFFENVQPAFFPSC